MLSSVINAVGDWGPIAMIFIAIWMLYVAGNKTYVYYFVVGLIINTLANIILKGAIQQPRPADMNNPGFHKRVRNILATRHGMPFNLFGMPSGHAQAVAYILTFLWATIWRWGGRSVAGLSGGWLIKGVLLLIGLVVLVQRVEWGHHTMFQVAVGAAVGVAIGWGAYKMGGGKLQSGGAGGLSKRADDGAVWSHRVQAGFL